MAISTEGMAMTMPQANERLEPRRNAAAAEIQSQAFDLIAVAHDETVDAREHVARSRQAIADSFEILRDVAKLFSGPLAARAGETDGAGPDAERLPVKRRMRPRRPRPRRRSRSAR
ncbi:hypothetical protein [Jiella sp. M17.18]|uniref:hypothetical protein n=1 Tax=Jiella sp. M17.18 TaxID=3234247 RepID=UPI0034DE043D